MRYGDQQVMKHWIAKTLFMIAMVVISIYVGLRLGEACQSVAILKWLGVFVSFSIDPPFKLIFDGVLELNIGFFFQMNLIQAIFIIISVVIYEKVART